MGGSGKSKNGGNKGSSSPAPDNSAQIKTMQDQQAQQAQAFAKQQADAIAVQQAAQEAARKAAEDAARQQAIASQSANARSLATTNQQEIGSALSNPMQSGTMNYGAQASGYNPAAAKQTQAAQMGSAGTPAPMAAPSAAIAAKVNADSGGTNAVQNRYTMPNTTGLQFGGT